MIYFNVAGILCINYTSCCFFSAFWKTVSTEQVPCFIRFRYGSSSIKFGSTSKQYKEQPLLTSSLLKALPASLINLLVTSNMLVNAGTMVRPGAL